MKRFLLISIFTCIYSFLWAYDVKVDGIYYNLDNVNYTASVTYKDGDRSDYSGVMTIPGNIIVSSVTYSVTSIGERTFYGCSKLTSINIAQSITKIGRYAFYDCSNLTTVVIHNQSIEIDYSAFYNCSKLKEININSIVNIKDKAFYGCKSLCEIEFSEALISIGSSAFEGCTAIQEISLPNSLTTIGGGAFSGCTSISNLIIGNGVKELGGGAFYSCIALESVSIGKSLENIENQFYGCNNIKNLTYLEGCEKTIPTNFQNVTNVSLPQTLIEISDEAFYGFENLTSIEIPNKVRFIGRSAFAFCYNLSDILIGENIEQIADIAFHYCSSLHSIAFGDKLTKIGEAAFDGCVNLTELRLNEGLLEIGPKAFRGCRITNISTPTTLISIGEGAFANCENLTELNIANGLKNIGSYAFLDCSKLTKLKLPDSVISIGSLAFSGSSTAPYFSDVQIGNGIEEIKGVFAQSKVDRMVVGNKISEINDYIFSNSQAKLFLLTNNIVNLISSSYDSPSCETYVIDASKYSNEKINKYGIKNIVSISHYEGEYTGTAPELNFSSQLSGYNATICGDYYSAGSYTSLEVNFSKEDFSSTIVVPCNYTITKAPLSIIPFDSTISYGEDIPEFDCFYQGLKNNETPDYALSVLPSLATNAKKDSNAGEYRIYATGAESKNYSITYQTGTLTIKPAKQSIIWEQFFDGIVSDSKIELTAVSSCGLPIKYTSSNSSIAYIAEEGDKTYLYALKDGSVVITASQVGNNNYEAAPSISKTIEIFPKSATGISLDHSSIEIIVGQTTSLTAIVSPETTQDKSVTWSTSNAFIASVDQNGLVTANTVGEAIITATTTDGSNLSASCKVTVTPILATSITIDKKTAEIYIGDNTTLTATVLPEDATSKSVAWTSSDESIASVANGVVQGVSAGTVTITASTTDGSNLSATCLVTVKSRVATSITLNSSSEDIVVGNSCQLSATVLPEDIPNKSVTWSSNNTSIASVDQNGLVAANNVGEATITATTTDGSDLSASCKITVTPILATSITLDKTTAEINVGGHAYLSVTILPETATYKSVTWRSSNESVATVTDGIVIGNAPGTAIISASTTDGSQLTATCTVTVLDVLATMISLDKEALDLYVDEATTLTVAVYPDNTTNKAVTWTSSNASVATVADGVVTAKSEGAATITAKTTDGSNLFATCQITVKRHPQTITWDQDLSTVVSGGELIKLEATASSGLDITFNSSDENIASIFMFSDGAYLNAYGEGNVTITASQAGNNYYAPASIVKTVNVVASSSIKDVTSEGLFTIYTLNGFKVGTFTSEEYQRLKLAKGIYIVNGRKTAIK